MWNSFPYFPSGKISCQNWVLAFWIIHWTRFFLTRKDFGFLNRQPSASFSKKDFWVLRRKTMTILPPGSDRRQWFPPRYFLKMSSYITIRQQYVIIHTSSSIQYVIMLQTIWSIPGLFSKVPQLFGHASRNLTCTVCPSYASPQYDVCKMLVFDRIEKRHENLMGKL